MAKCVPLIDFDAFSLDRDDQPDGENFQKLVDEVHNALTTVGFMSLVNHGIPADKVLYNLFP